MAEQSYSRLCEYSVVSQDNSGITAYNFECYTEFILCKCISQERDIRKKGVPAVLSCKQGFCVNVIGF